MRQYLYLILVLSICLALAVSLYNQRSSELEQSLTEQFERARR